MLTGELKNKVDAIWNIFYSGGLSNPLDIVEQVDKSKVVIQKSLDETKLLFDSLMQRYFKTF